MSPRMTVGRHPGRWQRIGACSGAVGAPSAADLQHGVIPAGETAVARAADTPVAKRPDELVEQVCLLRPGGCSKRGAASTIQTACKSCPLTSDDAPLHLGRSALRSRPAPTRAAVRARGWDRRAAGLLAVRAAPLITVTGRAGLLLSLVLLPLDVVRRTTQQDHEPTHLVHPG